MCALCEGKTYAEVVENLWSDIVTLGFAVMTVGDGPDDRGVVYTIGLTHRCDHPELVMSGYPIAAAAEILRDFGCYVSRGNRVDRWRAASKCGVTFGLVPVDQEHIDAGLMNAWFWCYEGADVGSPAALQVLVPEGSCCFKHQTTQPILGPLNVRRHPRWGTREDLLTVVRLPTEPVSTENRLTGA